MTAAAPTLPTRRDEAWRYTPVEEVAARLAAATAPTDRGDHGVDRATVDRLAGSLGGPRLVSVNGRFRPELSDLDGLPAGVSVGPGSVAHGPPARDDGFRALSRAAGQQAVAVAVADGVDAGPPIHLVHIASPGRHATVSHPATVIVAGSGCSLSVVETYAGTPGPALTNASTTIRAGERARVRHWRIEAEAPDAVHIGHTGVVQQEGAEVLLLSVLLGATIGRHAHDVVLAGPDGRCDVVGLAVPAGRQVHDHLVTVEHAAARCTNTQRFRAVVDDRARSSFSGHVIVRPGTVATSADQSSHNLLLAPTAEADARPWLEILADDVRCTHGATVGRLDDDALFYLRSRGIPLAQARDLLIDAFVQELLDRIDCTPLRARIESELAGRRRGAKA